jgi:hypothetical protein
MTKQYERCSEGGEEVHSTAVRHRLSTTASVLIGTPRCQFSRHSHIARTTLSLSLPLSFSRHSRSCSHPLTLLLLLILPSTLTIHPNYRSTTLVLVVAAQVLLRSAEGFARRGLRASVGLAHGLCQQLLMLQHLAIYEAPGHEIVFGCSLRRNCLHFRSLVCDAILDRLVGGDGGVAHGLLEAGLGLGGVSFLLLHAEDERPGLQGCVARGDGVDVSAQFVLHARVDDVGFALRSSVLAGVRSITIVLSIAVSHKLQRDNRGQLWVS